MEENVYKPYIAVMVKKPDSVILREVLAGVEEEGIPYGIDTDCAGDILKKTYEAAYSSRMGIALGVDGTRVVLHYNKLKESMPILDENLKYYEKNKARRIGNNAARLYKVMPFKRMDGLKEDAEIDDVKAHVIAVLNSTLNREGYR